MRMPCSAGATPRGTALLIDLCGFTRLTQQQGRAGRAGAEALTTFLDHSFGPIVDHISDCGGDVVAFAGDSVLAVWDAEGHEDSAEVATRCALELREKHHALRSSGALHPAAHRAGKRRSAAPGARWRGRSLVAPGGGRSRRRGPSRRCAAPRGPGGPRPEHRSTARGARTRHPVRRGLHREPDWPRTRTGRPLAFESSARPSSARSSKASSLTRSARESGSAHPSLLAEFRHVTSAFFALDAGLAQDPGRLQDVVATAQHALRNLDGILYQVIQDDKGLILVAVFGVPPCSHDDDPVRGVRVRERADEPAGRDRRSHAGRRRHRLRLLRRLRRYDTPPIRSRRREHESRGPSARPRTGRRGGVRREHGATGAQPTPVRRASPASRSRAPPRCTRS